MYPTLSNDNLASLAMCRASNTKSSAYYNIVIREPMCTLSQLRVVVLDLVYAFPEIAAAPERFDKYLPYVSDMFSQRIIQITFDFDSIDACACSSTHNTCAHTHISMNTSTHTHARSRARIQTHTHTHIDAMCIWDKARSVRCNANAFHVCLLYGNLLDLTAYWSNMCTA